MYLGVLSEHLQSLHPRLEAEAAVIWSPGLGAGACVAEGGGVGGALGVKGPGGQRAPGPGMVPRVYVHL